MNTLTRGFVAPLILIIAVLLVLGGGTYYYAQIKVNFNSMGSSDAIRISILAAERNDPLMCNKIKLSKLSVYGPQSSLINECFLNLAVLTQNKKICDLIPLDNGNNETYKNYCYKQSSNDLNPIMCEKFRDSRDSTEWLNCMDELQQKDLDRRNNVVTQDETVN